MRKYIIFLVALFLISSASALGVTPGRTTLEYDPGQQETVVFTVVNTENIDMDLVAIVNEFDGTVLDLETFSMSAEESSRVMQYTFTMPSDLEPGPHTAEIVIVQLPEKAETSEAFVGAAVGVTSQVNTFVPLPNKYAETTLNIIGPGSDGLLTFVAPVLNRGQLDIVRARATIDIFGPFNDKIATLNTNDVSVKSGKRAEIVATWNPNVQPGPYRAVATVLYDEELITVEKEFSVGDRLLELQNIEVNDFSLGEIAKFEILVENKWSETIAGAFAQMLIFNSQGQQMAELKSPSYNIPPLEKQLMTAFWDSAGASEGTYDATLYLKFGSSAQQQELELEVEEDEIRVVGVGYVIASSPSESPFGIDNSLVIILGTVIGILVIINLLWFLIIRKKLSKKVQSVPSKVPQQSQENAYVGEGQPF